MEDRGNTEKGLLLGGIGGTALGVALAMLLAAKPAEAAPPEEKLDYLIELLTALIPVLAEVAEGQSALITAFLQWLAAQGIPGVPPAEGIEVTVKTSWEAKEPEQIFDQAIRSIGTFDADKMVDWTKGKRFLLKVESSLDQACTIQLLGNMSNSFLLPINIGAVAACPAGANISIGPAWDDWHPFIGARIVTAVAPTAGILKIWAVIQE
ncbi:hypothetical protein ES703_117926 [subsurface metagenome]